MANAYNNKVVLSNGTTVIDLSTDTVTNASHIMTGHRGHLADGSVVDGTGASDSQVVSIRDVPNSTGITAEITGVPAPDGSIEISQNGTVDVTDYEEAIVNVPTLDVPIFTSSDGVNVTCNKTYAQCLAILNGGENRAFISFAGSNPESLAGINDLGVLKYYYVYSGALNARIQYRSNGSITISSVDTGQTLDVTSNGTYTASDDNAWARVNVNVPTGSATIQPLTVTSNGTYTAPSGVDGYSPVTVNVSGGGGSVDPDADVIFIDYDGTVLYSYSAAEFAELTEMPENPTHDGLVSEGWNWSLEDAKGQVSDMGTCIIGQTYNTSNNGMNIYVTIERDMLDVTVKGYPNGTFLVDWGDNSATSQLQAGNSSTIRSVSHEYSAPGDYVISITPKPGVYCTEFRLYGSVTTTDSNTNVENFFLKTANSGNARYAAAIHRVEIGGVFKVSAGTFRGCRNLETFTARLTTFVSGSTYRFHGCYRLKAAVVSNIGEKDFFNCQSLGIVSIAKITSVGTNTIPVDAFRECRNLSRISLQAGIVPGNYAFYSSGLKKIKIKMTSSNSLGTYFCSSCANLIEAEVLHATAGTVVTLPGGAFNGCYKLSTFKTESGFGTASTSNFNACYMLDGVVVARLDHGSTFNNCRGLRSVTIKEGATKITSSSFYNCLSLESITIPSSVTSIEASAFNSCFALSAIHLLSDTPPTLANTSAFANIAPNPVFYVPKGSLEAYQTATNWSTYASYMVEEE